MYWSVEPIRSVLIVQPQAKYSLCSLWRYGCGQCVTTADLEAVALWLYIEVQLQKLLNVRTRFRDSCNVWLEQLKCKSNDFLFVIQCFIVYGFLCSILQSTFMLCRYFSAKFAANTAKFVNQFLYSVKKSVWKETALQAPSKC